MEAIRKVVDIPVSNGNAVANRKTVSPVIGTALRMPVVFEQPAVPRPLTLLKMPDETLDYYAFLFCQRGFHGLGMTFEQFLEVVDAVRPGGLRSSYENQ
jgi:hypothetical protein